MLKRGLLLSALTLLMVGCSNVSTPVSNPAATTPAVDNVAMPDSDNGTPDSTTPTPAPTPTPTPTVPEDSTSEGMATEAEAASATQGLQSLALNLDATSVATTNVVAARADGTVMANSQPMFPMGFYHVSWAGNAARRLADMKTIAAMGFNAMNVSMIDPDDLNTFRTFLDTAQAKGMKLFVEDYSDTAIKAIKDHPAMLGWMVADDCNNRYTPAEVQSRAAAVKALDPNHLTYTSMAISFSNDHSAYFGKTDVVGDQAYPIGVGDPLTMVYPVMQTLVKQSVANGSVPIANLQSFKWQGGRYPTAAELNSMTNQALAAGVKGILYYAYLDPTNDMASYTGLNPELKKLANEMKLLTPVLTQGERTELSTNSQKAAAHMWTYSGKRYVQVISLNETASQTLKVTLPSAASSLTPLFANRPKGMKVSGTQISGPIAAYSTQWYEVK